MHIILPILQAVDEVMEKILNDMHVQCRQCPHHDACCNTLVGVTHLEAELIIEYLLETKQWSLVREKLLAQRKDSIKIGSFLDDREKGPYDTAAWKWFERGKPCALYDTEKKQCRVYEVRPLACRELFAALGTACDKGDSQTTTLSRTHAEYLMRMNWELHHDIADLCGELSQMMFRALQMKQKEQR